MALCTIALNLLFGYFLILFSFHYRVFINVQGMMGGWVDGFSHAHTVNSEHDREGRESTVCGSFHGYLWSRLKPWHHIWLFCDLYLISLSGVSLRKAKIKVRIWLAFVISRSSKLVLSLCFFAHTAGKWEKFTIIDYVWIDRAFFSLILIVSQ